MDYGLKVSKPGEDVNTRANSYTNIKKFSLLSSVDVSGAAFSLLKVKTSAKVTLANSASTTVAHGLPYKPMFWVFMNNSGTVSPVYYDTSGTFAYIDSTNLVISNSEGGSRDFYYYIFYDQV